MIRLPNKPLLRNTPAGDDWRANAKGNKGAANWGSRKVNAKGKRGAFIKVSSKKPNP